MLRSNFIARQTTTCLQMRDTLGMFLTDCILKSFLWFLKGYMTYLCVLQSIALSSVIPIDSPCIVLDI